MLHTPKKYTFDAVIRLFITVLFSVGVFWIIHYLSDVLIPFVIAFLLAYIINPLVLIVQKKIPHRGSAVALILTSIVLIFSLLLFLILPIIAREFSQSITLISRLASDSRMTQKAIEFIPQDMWIQIKSTISSFDMQALLNNKESLAHIQELLRPILPGAFGVMAGTAQILMGIAGIFIIILYLIFLLKDFNQSKEEWQSLLPHAYKEPILLFLREIDQAMSTYFRAQSLVAALVGILFACGFWAINLPLGIVLGLTIGVLNMVPYLQIIALLPALFLGFIGALETGTNPIIMLSLVVALFVIIQIIQDALLTPKIMGSATGLSPAMILLSISIWGKLLGVLGLIIAIPFSCVLLASYKRMQSAKKHA